MNQIVGVIPARLGSTRLPGKVLLRETGKPLIQHVWESCKKSRRLGRVVVATDDQTVLNAVAAFGGEAVLTSRDHPNGTSRLAEAARLLKLAPDDVVVNIQGDEPEVEPDSIDAAVDALFNGRERDVNIGTIAVPFQPHENPRDPNCVKVVLDLAGNALLFSRSLIPFDRDATITTDAAPLRHVGLYVYRRSFLDIYLGLASTPLERAEQLEQLRALQHGYRIAVAVRPTAAIGIDTPEQYAAFVSRWRSAHACV